jgi:endonuclease/exonuclease/phosphatase family metal-dependent hydrolase
MRDHRRRDAAAAAHLSDHCPVVVEIQERDRA